MNKGVIFGDSWVTDRRLESKLINYGNLKPPIYKLCISPHISDRKNHVKISWIEVKGEQYFRNSKCIKKVIQYTQ